MEITEDHPQGLWEAMAVEEGVQRTTEHQVEGEATQGEEVVVASNKPEVEEVHIVVA